MIPYCYVSEHIQVHKKYSNIFNSLLGLCDCDETLFFLCLTDIVKYYIHYYIHTLHYKQARLWLTGVSIAGGERSLGSIYAGINYAAGIPEPLRHYSLSVASYRHRLSHFWANDFLTL